MVPGSGRSSAARARQLSARFVAKATNMTAKREPTVPQIRVVRCFRAARNLLGFAVTFTIFSCAASTTPSKLRLYPVSSPELGEPGALEGEFLFNRYGHGPFRVAYYDGLQCSGEYNTLFDDELVRLTLWGGATLRSVVGSAGRNVAPGTATGTCPDGTLIECAYLVNRVGSHGSGLCRDSRGGEYKLHF